MAIGFGLHFYAQSRVQIAQENFAARIGAQVARIGNLVADVEIAADVENANRLISLLLSDRGVRCVELHDGGQRIATVSAPRQVGCLGEPVDEIESAFLIRLHNEADAVPSCKSRIGEQLLK